MTTVPQGVYDPPYYPGCTSDSTAPTCSVFVPVTSYIQRQCSSPWYPADFAPPPEAGHSGDWVPFYNGVLPDDLENDPISCDLNQLQWWVHEVAIEGPVRFVNLRLEYSNPGSLTLVERQVISPVPPDWFGPFSYTPGTFVATTASPIQVQISIQGLYVGPPGTDTWAFEWGASIWSDEFCLTPPVVTIPSKLATIVG